MTSFRHKLPHQQTLPYAIPQYGEGYPCVLLFSPVLSLLVPQRSHWEFSQEKLEKLNHKVIHPSPASHGSVQASTVPFPQLRHRRCFGIYQTFLSNLCRPEFTQDQAQHPEFSKNIMNGLFSKAGCQTPILLTCSVQTIDNKGFGRTAVVLLTSEYFSRTFQK